MAMLAIKGMARYAISRDGKVLDLAKNREVKSFIRNGYLCVRLKDGDKYKNKYIHRLIAEAYIPNPDDKPCINHINGDKMDNNIENLEWCTKKENNLHAYRFGLRESGRGGGKNSPIMCVEDNIVFISITAAAEYYKIGRRAINECLSGRNKTCNRKHWKYI